MNLLVKEAKQLIEQGIYDPEKLYQIIYHRHPVHYSRVREAVHIAKVT